MVPDDVGGRFSVLTAVGLLPIAASGARYRRNLWKVPAACVNSAWRQKLEKNDAIQYAADP